MAKKKVKDNEGVEKEVEEIEGEVNAIGEPKVKEPYYKKGG